ncbi:GCN5-related N-acetyltransferase [Anaeromyces robustus]|uniref:GCN5-related N-acetyltransferase n=1 Tax=Anaeromyces robustus TaxID=1754192 RepID=A0A1Y1XLM1_9FUNG|nr:GCN5-related N-acetyltransferase [Anaeromyces robustus]|eukprot:ORX86648.1 GCN5-related N-acetyltransferase [Anaeromyces robustus]
MRYNQYNQPIGDAVENYEEGSWPDVICLEGKTVRVERLNMNHAKDMYEYLGPNSDPKLFSYVPLEAFTSYEEFEKFMKESINLKDPYIFVVIDKVSGKAVGNIGLMDINRKYRTIEMGWVLYSNKLKRTRQATEAQYLVMEYVFEVLKYRRYEWKCDHFNSASRNAALRLGFTFEGTFRNAMVYKGRNRDTDWLSIIDSEWESNKKRLQAWLSDDNFDENGNQKQSLSSMKIN